VEVLLSETTRAPLVFIHGLWMHATSWDDWSDLFTDSGYQCIAPGWPGDSSTVDETRANAFPAPARPLFQAGFANFAPRSEATVDTRRERGPLLPDPTNA
jgi:pimeloyl-ACP methyl ester carboxylesterase